MFEKTKYLLFFLAVAFSVITGSDLFAQPLTRLLGGDGIVIDSRTTPYRAVTLYVPQILSSTYTLALPSTPPPGPLSFFAADVNGIMSWVTGLPLPTLPKGNIWVGNSANVATPYAPTTPGSVLILDPTGTPAWSSSIPSLTTLSISQLTTGTLQPGVTFNVGNNSTITSTGGNIVANNLNGAGTGKYAGNAPIPLNALTMNISYPGIKAGASITLTITDPSLPGIAVYLQTVTPGVGFSVAFSAPYFSATGVVTYIAINP